MTELRNVLTYIEGLPEKLQAGALNDPDRIIFYVIHNRLIEAINLENPQYKTMADLMKESFIAIREMRDDIQRMVTVRYNGLPLMENILFVDAITELGKVSLNSYQDCVEYLSDLTIASYATVLYNSNIKEDTRLMLNTLIYISISGLNLFNIVKGLPPERKGIEVSFDRKRKQGLGA